jgi:hypothetical protein
VKAFHGIVARGRDEVSAVAHDDVPSFPNDREASTFEGAHGVAVGDTGDARHLKGYFDVASDALRPPLRKDREIFADGILDVRERLRFVRTLRPTSGQCGAADGNALFGGDQDDLVADDFSAHR